MKTYTPIATDPRYYPLKKVISRAENNNGHWIETLECGHKAFAARSVYGLTYATRRRCSECAKTVEANIAKEMKERCAGNPPKIIKSNDVEGGES